MPIPWTPRTVFHVGGSDRRREEEKEGEERREEEKEGEERREEGRIEGKCEVMFEHTTQKNKLRGSGGREESEPVEWKELHVGAERGVNCEHTFYTEALGEATRSEGGLGSGVLQVPDSGWAYEAFFFSRPASGAF